MVVAAFVTTLPLQAATTTSRPLQVNGAVPVRCKISLPAAGASLNTTFSAESNGGELDLTDFVGQDAKTHATEGAIRLPILCSGAYALTITSHGGGLSNQSSNTASGGFAVHVDYLLSASWAGATRSVQTSGAEVTLDLSQSGAQSGDLSVAFSLPAGLGPLVAGAYRDEIIIQLNPQ